MLDLRILVVEDAQLELDERPKGFAIGDLGLGLELREPLVVAGSGRDVDLARLRVDRPLVRVRVVQQQRCRQQQLDFVGYRIYSSGSGFGCRTGVQVTVSF